MQWKREESEGGEEVKWIEKEDNVTIVVVVLAVGNVPGLKVKGQS